MTEQRASQDQTTDNHLDTAAWEETFVYNLGPPSRELRALRRAFFANFTDGSRDDLERIIAGELSVRGIGDKGIATLRVHLAWYNTWRTARPAHESRGALMDAQELLERYNAGERNLAGVNLRQASLAEAILYHADLSGANLAEASLERANLQWATLSKADLSRANLTEANLTNAILSGADLSGANLSGTTSTGTIYNHDTIWPTGFNPALAKAAKVD